MWRGASARDGAQRSAVPSICGCTVAVVPWMAFVASVDCGGDSGGWVVGAERVQCCQNTRPSMTLLEVENLEVEFRSGGGWVRAVDGVSFGISAGEVVGLVGESGSGKSVTALSLARLLPSPPARYAGGKIILGGQDVLELPESRLRSIRGGVVGYVFQDPGASLNPVSSVGAQILEVLRVHRRDKANAAEVVRLLQQVGISAPETRARDFPHQLSGGMQQRVTIALALAARPRLLVADEPTTALDVTIQAQILSLLRDINRDLGMAILLITHNLGLITDMADRILVMYAGQIVESGPAKEVLQHPRHPYTRALIRSVPQLGLDVARLTAIPGAPPSPGAWPGGCRFHPRCPEVREDCRVEVPALARVTNDPASRFSRCPYSSG